MDTRSGLTDVGVAVCGRIRMGRYKGIDSMRAFKPVFKEAADAFRMARPEHHGAIMIVSGPGPRDLHVKTFRTIHAEDGRWIALSAMLTIKLTTDELILGFGRHHVNFAETPRPTYGDSIIAILGADSERGRIIGEQDVDNADEAWVKQCVAAMLSHIDPSRGR